MPLQVIMLLISTLLCFSCAQGMHRRKKFGNATIAQALEIALEATKSDDEDEARNSSAGNNNGVRDNNGASNSDNNNSDSDGYVGADNSGSSSGSDSDESGDNNTWLTALTTRLDDFLLSRDTRCSPTRAPSPEKNYGQITPRAPLQLTPPKTPCNLSLHNTPLQKRRPDKQHTYYKREPLALKIASMSPGKTGTKVRQIYALKDQLSNH